MGTVLPVEPLLKSSPVSVAPWSASDSSVEGFVVGFFEGALVGVSVAVGSADGSSVGVSLASGTELEEFDEKRLPFVTPIPTPATSTNAAAMETGAIHLARGLKAIICAPSSSLMRSEGSNGFAARAASAAAALAAAIAAAACTAATCCAFSC